MKYIVNSLEMKLYDKNTTGKLFVPSAVLMERAAVAFVEVLKKQQVPLEQVLVVCGSGNNGGDGYAIARLLWLAGADVDVVSADENANATDENLLQKKIWRAYGNEIRTEIPVPKKYTAVVDAVFGVGLSRNIEGTYAKLIGRMNGIPGRKIAVDVPSGVSSDNGSVLCSAFRADLTVTFAFAKLGCLLWPGNTCAGEVIVADIGIDRKSFFKQCPAVAAYERSDLSVLAKRESHSNKGTYGKLLVIAGSVDMSGAAYLSAKAAYLSGCGLVRVLTPEENRTTLQTRLPEAVLTTYTAKNPDMNVVAEALNWADAIVCGPGIGTGEASRQIVTCVLQNASVPVLMDADALNLIAEDVSVLKKPHTELVVTPHLGEMSRLCGASVSCIQSHLTETAQEFAREYQVICVLKDEHTVSSVPYRQTYLNLSGNSGMATAGSGDVLSGIIGGLMAQGVSPGEAAPLGVYLHGLSGDEACKRTGKRSMMASDILEGMTHVICELEQ